MPKYKINPWNWSDKWNIITENGKDNTDAAGPRKRFFLVNTIQCEPFPAVFWVFPVFFFVLQPVTVLWKQRLAALPFLWAVVYGRLPLAPSHNSERNRWYGKKSQGSKKVAGFLKKMGFLQRIWNWWWSWTLQVRKWKNEHQMQQNVIVQGELYRTGDVFCLWGL